jgi:adenylate cyclase
VETPPVERKLVAILAADVVEYSRLMHEDEEGTLATLSSHREVVDTLIQTLNGRISNTAGDSVLAEFASVVDAIRCAVGMQQTLFQANSNLASERRMQFRIGINVGDVIMKDGDLFGDGINVAARLEALADPGGICVTRGVRDAVRDKIPYTFEDMGEQKVKNIPRPVRFYKVMFNPEAQVEVEAIPSEGAVRPKDTTSDPPLDPIGVDIEITFWETVKDSSNVEMFEAYIEKYPEGEFRSLADIRIAELQSSR